MTTEIARLDTANPQHIDRGLTFLKRLLTSPHVDQAECDGAGRVVCALTEPADPVRTMARVAALLEPYFDKGTSVAIKEIEMEDWAEAMKDAPYWAIERACRWWKSGDNPNKRKRPLEGDIMERVRIEMGAVNAAKIRLQSPRLHAPEAEPRISPSPEDVEERRKLAEEILSRFRHAPSKETFE